MARYQMELPTEVMKQFERIYDNADEIFGEMTKAGAEVVMQNIKANAPASFKASRIMNCLRLTKSYKTPSDDGINTNKIFKNINEVTIKMEVVR